MRGDRPMPILELTYIAQGLLFSTVLSPVTPCFVVTVCAAVVLSLAGKSTRSLFVTIELKS